MVKLLSKCAVNAVLVVRVVLVVRIVLVVRAVRVVCGRTCVALVGPQLPAARRPGGSSAPRGIPPRRARTGGRTGRGRRPGQNTASDAFVMSVISM